MKFICDLGVGVRFFFDEYNFEKNQQSTELSNYFLYKVEMSYVHSSWFDVEKWCSSALLNVW